MLLWKKSILCNRRMRDKDREKEPKEKKRLKEGKRRYVHIYTVSEGLADVIRSCRHRRHRVAPVRAAVPASFTSVAFRPSWSTYMS